MKKGRSKLKLAVCALMAVLVFSMGTINVSAVYDERFDFNNDNVVDILDMQMAASEYNTNGATYDGNSDGIVNLFDLVAIGSAFGEKTEVVNAVFIHHSTGGALIDHGGLDAKMNALNYYLADTDYGWGPDSVGSRTDTEDWPEWFDLSDETVMDALYPYLGTYHSDNTIDPADGENTIIMFKSCYPNSEVGSSIDDEKAIYNSLLPYFAEHPDKMFVLFVPPPEININTPELTRELANWLYDTYQPNYYNDLSTPKNLYVYDYYNTLTHPDNHHYVVNGEEVHVVANAQNTLYYYTGTNNHPTAEGQTKAADELAPLIDLWYKDFKANQLIPLS